MLNYIFEIKKPDKHSYYAYQAHHFNP